MQVSFFGTRCTCSCTAVVWWSHSILNDLEQLYKLNTLSHVQPTVLMH